MRRLLSKQITLARLVARAPAHAKVRINQGSAHCPFEANGTVWVGEHFWWGCLTVPDIDAAIAAWRRGEGSYYDRQQRPIEEPKFPGATNPA